MTSFGTGRHPIGTIRFSEPHSPGIPIPLNTSEHSALKLEGLARRFGVRWALRGITLEVRPGEVVGIMGHNGSGKSTLLRVIATVLRPSAGDGWVFGNHLVRNAVDVRRDIGFLAHAPGLYEDLTAAENLRFAAQMFGVAESGIPFVLERVGLSSAQDERVRGFSAGMPVRMKTPLIPSTRMTSNVTCPSPTAS